MEDAAEVQEFPKMLYQGGQVRDEAGRPVREPLVCTVHNAEEEADARGAGFMDANQPEGAVEDDAPEGEGGESTTAAAVDPDPVEGTAGADAVSTKGAKK
jgi:hypothetical protein